MEQGKKNDIGKLRFDLLPVEPLRQLAEVYTIGANKYSDRNWEKGLKWGRVFAAMMRHAFAWWSGEKRDPVDGQHHLASVAWCALTLMEYERTHPELDDRIQQEVKVSRYSRATKVYLASRFEDRDEVMLFKKGFEEAGCIVTSKWLLPDANEKSMPEFKKLPGFGKILCSLALDDINDISDADVVIILSPKKAHGNGTGGRHVELGIALALGKVVYLVGERENVFHYHPAIRFRPSVIEVVNELNCNSPASLPIIRD